MPDFDVVCGGLFRIKEYDINYVLLEFTKCGEREKVNHNSIEFLIKRRSGRYILFKNKGLKCVVCGKTANKCFLECIKGQEPVAHFNFYFCKDGSKDLLFTKDHIHPKSLGGKNRQKNYQTMCVICNSKKGSHINIEIEK